MFFEGEGKWININFKLLTSLTCRLDDIFNLNQQFVYVNKIIRKNNISIKNFYEFNENSIKGMHKFKKFLLMVVDIKNQQDVIVGSIISNYTNVKHYLNSVFNNTILDNQRLENIIGCLNVEEDELIRDYTLSNISKKIDKIVIKNGEEWSNISMQTLQSLIFNLDEIFEYNRQMNNTNKKIRENNISTNGFTELNKNVLKGLQDLKIFVEKLIDLKNQKFVLRDSINTTDGYLNVISDTFNVLSSLNIC